MRKHLHSIINLTLVVILLSLGSFLVIAQTDTAADLRIAFVSNRRGNDDIFLMTQNGEEDPVPNLTNNPARDWSPAWSPAGDQIIFNSDRDGRDTLYVMNADGTEAHLLFPGETFNDYDAAWSPDGAHIAFISDRGGKGRELYLSAANGSDVQQITDIGTLKGDPTWSPDGTELAYWEQDNSGEIHMYRLNPSSDTVARITTIGPANGSPVWVGDDIYFDSNRDGKWWSIYRMKSNGDFPQRMVDAGVNTGRVTVAPDGSKIAYVTDQDDSDEIYIMNADKSFPRRLTNNSFSDNSPAWQPKIPENQLKEVTEPAAQATEVAAAEVTPEEGEEDLLGAAVGLSVSGIDAHPISEQQLLIDYGIKAWQDAGWTGAGQKVGVIDLSFGGLAEFETRYGEVHRPQDDALSSYTVDNNRHGTEVLEVVHTVAPNVELYACRYEGLLDQLKECANWMIASGVKIINHSVGLPVLPLDGESDFSQFVNDIFQQDVLWVNSAGNFHQGFVSGNFTDTNGDAYHDFYVGSRPRPLQVNLEEGDSYSGTILLSWKDSQFPLYDPQTGAPLRVDLDLEIVDRIDPSVVFKGEKRQGENFDLPLFEIVNIPRLDHSFEIRVKNAGLPLEENIEFAVFVEFAPLASEVRTNKGSVVAPADARNALTVGSVNGNRELGSYSSQGLAITTYEKPDLSAPGEIYLADGTPFIGTSAAAPVVSGIAALLMEQDPGLRIDQLPRQLTQVWIVPVSDHAYGSGIVQLGAPPSQRLDIGVVDTPPYTVFPRPDEKFIDQGFTCATQLGTRLAVEVPGYVNYDLGLAIRQQPDGGSPQLDTLNFNTQFLVVGGPTCSNGAYWWQVKLDTGALGWVSEGFDYYLIAPVSLERARLPKVYTTECPNSLTPQLSVGKRGRIIQGNLFFFRSEGAQNQMLPLNADTVVEVLGGPLCEGRSDNTLRWYVRVVEGERTGYEGWVAEGDTDTRLIQALSER